jgi:hypothetical protein
MGAMTRFRISDGFGFFWFMDIRARVCVPLIGSFVKPSEPETSMVERQQTIAKWLLEKQVMTDDQRQLNGLFAFASRRDRQPER